MFKPATKALTKTEQVRALYNAKVSPEIISRTVGFHAITIWFILKEESYRLFTKGARINDIARYFHIGYETLYTYIKERKETDNG